MANAGAGGDAVSRDFGDGRYMLVTDTLDLIEPPSADVDFNGYRITNLAAPVNG